MELVYITEARFIKDKSGSLFTADGTHTYKYFQRYLDVFEKVYVVGRVTSAEDCLVIKEELVEGANVQVLPLTGYLGIGGFVKNYFSIKHQLEHYITPGNVYILKVPGILGKLASNICREKKIRYGVEVVGDPYDVFAPGAVNHPLRSFLRLYFTKELKTIVKNAYSALFVTKEQLQRRYPCDASAFNTYASNVILDSATFASSPKTKSNEKSIEIISVGSLEQMYKAPDIVLKAIKMLLDDGILCKLTWLGDGRYKSEVEQIARNLNISSYVRFPGKVLSGDGVQKYLDESDMFVLASRTEGLPRALVEAMAKGLPCIGTNVGGIPELLDEEMIVPKDNAEALYKKIKYLLEHPEVMMRLAARNLEEAKLYSTEILTQRRLKFYESLLP
ncbi:glycosyltransferase family 4 protein [Pontibacter sp. Tf4]|uniref:glycosyltransferase family 4 protein n=1 Tax=Pontibacter sp. Tf4 TaxID=2761620 RepID=UPI0016263BB1|nr:glycosyltransferase family 4 protein [Pontibacter sp. Tf4]MBB6612715.1 glycosyltransferase family 4 protein [Pontibacter sp. Tf4]